MSDTMASNSSSVPGDITTAHKVLVGSILIVVVLAVLVEGAGTSHEWAVAIGLLLLGPLLLLGINNASKFTAFAASNPITNPKL